MNQMEDLSELDAKQIVSYALQSGLVKVKNDITEITWEDIKQLKLGVGKTPFAVRVKMEEDGTVTPTILVNFNKSSIDTNRISSAINSAIEDYESRIEGS